MGKLSHIDKDNRPTMVDVSDVEPAPVAGDTATVIGRNPSDPESAAGLANLAGTIPWEVFTRIGERVTRRYLAEDA